MMSSIRLAGLQLAVGLDWYLVSERAELRPLRKRYRRGCQVQLSSTEGLLLGLGSQQPLWSQPLYAGALLLARLAPQALIHQPLDSRHVWVCAVRGGLPLPGSDHVCGVAEAQHQLDELLQLAPATPILGEHPQAEGSLADLLVKAGKTELRQARLRTSASPLLPALAAASILACALACYALLREPQEPSITFVPPAQSMADDGSAKQRLRQQFDAAIAKARAEHLQQPSLIQAGEAWLRVFSSLPPSLQGYRAEQAQCDLQQCDVTWVAAPGAAARPDALPGQPLPASSDGKHKTRIVLAELPTQTYAPITSAQLNDYRELLVPHLRRVGARLDFGEAGTPLLVAPPAGLDAQPYRLGSPYSLRVNVAGWANVRSTLNQLASTPLIARRALLNLDQGRLSLQLEGRYVVAQD
jgi:hypothetical protein